MTDCSERETSYEDTCYGLVSILSPYLFQPQYKPRYYVAWGGILGVACMSPMFLVLYIRYYLNKENKRTDALVAQGIITETGVLKNVDVVSCARTEEVVDARLLDLSDVRIWPCKSHTLPL